MSVELSHRLPKTIIPIKYKISLIPNFENWTFTGTEIVDLKVTEDVNYIVFNASEIEVQSALVNGEKAVINYRKELEQIQLTLKSQIKSGQVKMELQFSGLLNDNLNGFYRSTYLTDDKREVKMAVTHFEASTARKAFPCWDEPCYRSNFDIILEVPKSKIALSNMPVKNQEPLSNDMMRYEFETTPKMSSYIVAFIVGELDYVESNIVEGLTIRVYTPLGKSHRGQFALDVACKAVPFYNKYFGVNYTLAKMDLVAIPDFAIGAMENWGLLTYRETHLLIDSAQSSAVARQTVALTVGHEIAHMWFGNLVTMYWWSDLWLKEGFASWIEYLCVDHCYPEFDIWTEFTFGDYSLAISLDSLRSSHPIEVVVNHPSEIDQIFDAISYCKGASIIRMLNDFLTSEVFKFGLNIYLKRHEYANANTEDLWSSLQQATVTKQEEGKRSVSEIMATWTRQQGLPVISVDSVFNEDSQIVGIKVQQQRYLPKHVSHPNDKEDDLLYWYVPITVCAIDDSTKILAQFVMEPNSQVQQFALNSPVSCDAIRINPNAIGFYHTQYNDMGMLDKLGRCLRSNQLNSRDRISLIIDQFALAKSGNISTVSAIEFALQFREETDCTVWNTLLSNLCHITDILEQANPALQPHIYAFQQHLLDIIFNKLGWKTEHAPDENHADSHADKKLRARIIGILGRSGQKSILNQCRQKFNEYSGDAANSDLSADLRAAVYSTVVTHGDEQTLNQMLKLLDQTDLHEERMRILTSMGCVPSHLLHRCHQLALHGNTVRKQDKYRVLLCSVRDSNSREVFWNLISQDWHMFLECIGNARMIGAVVKNAFSNYVTEEQYVKINEFFADKKQTFVRSIDQLLENISINMAQLQRDQQQLEQFFKKY